MIRECTCRVPPKQWSAAAIFARCNRCLGQGSPASYSRRTCAWILGLRGSQVNLEEDAGELVVTVRDNGIGIPGA